MVKGRKDPKEKPAKNPQLNSTERMLAREDTPTHKRKEVVLETLVTHHIEKLPVEEVNT